MNSVGQFQVLKSFFLGKGPERRHTVEGEVVDLKDPQAVLELLATESIIPKDMPEEDEYEVVHTFFIGEGSGRKELKPGQLATIPRGIAIKAMISRLITPVDRKSFYPYRGIMR